ncbi:MAG: putative ATPase [Myxococcota bacterium]|jgi:predicted ATPase
MSTILTLANRTVDLDTGEVSCGAQLTPLERTLLAYLADHSGPVHRDVLLRDVWGYAPDVVSRAVDATVNRLRLKIEDEPGDPICLRTVRGQGYALVGGSRDAPAAPLDRFFGRELELARLEQLWTDGARLVTVTGAAGVGKTRLVREHARRAGPGPFVDLAEARDEAAVVAQLASVLAPDTGHVFVVVDTAEHAIDVVVREISRFLFRSRLARVLVTSRERLRVAGERVVELGPLSVADGAALLQDRVAAGGARLGTPEAREVATRVEGLPLSLELAAALLDVFPPAALLKRLDDPLALLAVPRRAGPVRHRSLRSALLGSWTSLTASEQRALAQLSVFRGGFTADAAEAIVDSGTGTCLASLQALRAKSLVHRGPAGRLAVSVAVGALAGEQLDANDPVHARHAAWYATEAGRRIASGAEDLAWVREEADNVTAALAASTGNAARHLRNALAHTEGHGPPGTRVPAVTARSLPLEWIDHPCAGARDVVHVPGDHR